MFFEIFNEKERLDSNHELVHIIGQWLTNQGIPEIVRLTPALKSCESCWDLTRAFWVKRNNEMSRNIRFFASEFPGKRLVALCGFEHRYYLRSHLYDWD
jgi:hypothetical protein